MSRDKWKPISFTEWKLLNSIQVWFCSNQPYALQSGSNKRIREWYPKVHVIIHMEAIGQYLRVVLHNKLYQLGSFTDFQACEERLRELLFRWKPFLSITFTWDPLSWYRKWFLSGLPLWIKPSWCDHIRKKALQIFFNWCCKLNKKCAADFSNSLIFPNVSQPIMPRDLYNFQPVTRG